MTAFAHMDHAAGAAEAGQPLGPTSSPEGRDAGDAVGPNRRYSELIDDISNSFVLEELTLCNSNVNPAGMVLFAGKGKSK